MLLPQTEVLASCAGVRAILIIRFLRDVSFFANRCSEMRSALWPAKGPASKPAVTAESYRTLIEVVRLSMILSICMHGNLKDIESWTQSEYSVLSYFQVTLRDVLLDVPKHSWSDDFLRLACCNVTVLTPASASFSETAQPNMEGWAQDTAYPTRESTGSLDPSANGMAGSSDAWEASEGTAQSGEHLISTWRERAP